MITQEMAIALAESYLLRNRIAHEGYVDSRFMSAERFNRMYGYTKYNEDFWVVDFRKRLDKGTLAESPSAVSVEVFVESQKVELLCSP